ncbi:alpha/beta hydrolase [Mycobacterium sp. 1245805.9]|uniref:alpha/beta hydrolase n=1 Tax=Mycobacterium sp. 1245805.9 TaxID=1856862 RepID=UPI0009ECF98A|nr:alpha/beta fold hydrolase [Mycobacterium sp. 1245805.9]
MMRRAKITTEDGTILRAYLHAPDGTDAHPGIVMCPGFGGVKPHIDAYAALFAEAGFAVLNFDNRGFGTSGGQPRQELDPFKQLTDLRDAITFAESQPEFDSTLGFGVWGSSFSGGLALVTAANDPRVRCVVAQIPNVSGHRNAVKLYTAEQRDEIRRRAAIDRAARLNGLPPMTVPMFSDDPDELCAFPGDVPDEPRKAIEAGVWTNETTIRSLENFLDFEPAGWLPYITPKPLLMIIADHDRCTYTDVQHDVYQAAPEPKKLVTYDGGHFDAYTTFFQETGPPARDWFVEHLGAPVGEPAGTQAHG